MLAVVHEITGNLTNKQLTTEQSRFARKVFTWMKVFEKQVRTGLDRYMRKKFGENQWSNFEDTQRRGGLIFEVLNKLKRKFFLEGEGGKR